MLYLSILSLIFTIIITILYIKIRLQKFEINSVLNRNAEILQNLSELNCEKISYIQKIEQLNSKIEHLNHLLSETDKIRLQAFESTKAVLYDLGHDLSKRLLEIHQKETAESRELTEKNISKTTEKFHNEFERVINLITSLNRDVEQSKGTVELLKQSLLSPTGAGKLAEITLENILKSSGLRPNIDFIMQYTMQTNDNTKSRPDAVIFLPNGNLMVIDAKASKFLVDNEELDNLVKTINAHLKSLNNKEYIENIINNFSNKQKLFNNVIMLMFLPTEVAIEKLMEADNTFMTRAWGLCIFPVGPVGLMNMLSFAKFQISDQMRSENHKLIIEEVRKLLSSISSIADYSQKLGHNIQGIVATYDKFAASFNRYFLSRAKNIQKLGIDIGSKNIAHTLDRYQIVSSKSEIIEAEPIKLVDNND